MSSRAQQRFERIVHAFSSDVYRYAFSLCRNEALAEDLTQETFMRAWRFLEGLRDENKAKSWLLTTVRREHARLYERYQPVYDDIELDRLPEAPSSGADVTDLYGAIGQLPLKYREPLVLQVMGGYSGAEIARMLDIPRATVNTRLFRARQHLRRIVEDQDIGSPLDAQER